jgi:hypothetical protein
LARLLLWDERMIVLVGTYCFGTVLGWVAAFMIHHGRPGWREVKAAAGVLFGAALQAVFGKGLGIVVYGVGVVVAAVIYVLTLLFRPLRRAHNITEG